ncbi:PPE family protein, SVP subgroup [Mycobacterium paraterrae]|uniref:PPE domain-containing protein n=1 Tax=Mycobacterium paraterrae TaxID=577492 RepID=A0ABY3VTA2_9MYCO|nr:PPE domain-containing protein [Mycobacterium paraterrae]UMB70734.1 PPE domain-containing protein [Mycobacterium paraterrae]
MDFGSYPPEVNSARMYAGPGAGPLIAAAEAWNALAGELHSVADSYQSVVSGLTSGSWMGPASVSMAAAAASYVAWLRATAAQAEQTGAQVKAAAAAYQTAFTATVPPPMVAANRGLLASLIATNVFGRNTQAIAANEAQYAEMWAQDAAAMYGYSASSAAATQLPLFTAPQQNTNPTGEAGQSAAVGQTTGTAAGNVQSTIEQAFSAVPSALSAAAPAADAPDPLGTISDLISIFVDLPAGAATFTADIPLGSLGIVALPFDIVGALTGTHTDKIVSGWNGEQTWPGEGPAPVKGFPAPLLNLPEGTVPTRLSAGMADANRVGGLSVPPSWTVNTPAVKPTAVTLPALPAVAAAEESVSGASGSTLSQMALAGMAGRAMAGTVGTGVNRARSVVARPSDASKPVEPNTTRDDTPTEAKPRTVVTGVAAELREFARLRDEGILTDEEYTEQKNRLLGR